VAPDRFGVLAVWSIQTEVSSTLIAVTHWKSLRQGKWGRWI